MREILFRGKYNDKWTYGYFVQALDIENKPIKNCIIENMSNVNICDGMVKQDYYEIELNTLGQYTGLKDKNGTKIFEGDIFGDSKRTEIDVVVFEDGCFKLKSYGFVECCLDGNAYEERWGEWDCQPICNFCLEHDEILGNVHDNPELLTLDKTKE